MISRYDQPEMSAIWSEDSKCKYFLTVELALLRAWEKKFLVPTGTAESISKTAKINIPRINEIEKEVHHDIIAFCTSITEQVPSEFGKFFHYGCTSSDIIDTALSLQIRSSLELIMPEYLNVLKKLKELAIKTKDLSCIGRSHGMDAEPMSFGQKFLLTYAEFYRRMIELNDFTKNELTGQISGAVGNYTIVTPEIEALVMKELKLQVESVSTQVIPRDHIAKLMSIFALWGSSLERFCVELRHLHRSDVNEIQEGFDAKQKGSSTMPHKKNPIASENLSGVARLLRSYSQIALENIPLWHERDISHSITERIYLPDCFNLVFYSLKRLKKLLDNIQVNSEIITQRVEQNKNSHSSYDLHTLLPYFRGTREDLYRYIQESYFNSKDLKEVHDKLQVALVKQSIPDEVWVKLKDPNPSMKNHHTVFDRVFNQYPI